MRIYNALSIKSTRSTKSTMILILLAVCACLFGCHAADDSPIQLGSDAHLFIDDAGISRMSNITFVVNPPVVLKVVLRKEYPWENPSEYTNILDDGTGVYKMYYMNNFRPISNVALATSTDGLNWEKPNFGAVEFNGSKDNNVVMSGFPNYPGGTVMYDPHDPNPEMRYKYLTNYGADNKENTPSAEGVVMYTSPDGIHFTKQEIQLFPYQIDAQGVLAWDYNIEKYVGYFRGGKGPIGGRAVVRAVTDKPLEPWPFTYNPNPHFEGDNREMPHFTIELPTVLSTDTKDPSDSDLYNSQVFVYTWAPKVYFAFPTCYYHYRQTRERTFLSPDREGGNKGVGEVQLAVSRDGITWKRYRRPAYIKHGWHGDQYTGWPWLFQGMLRNGNKIYHYGSLRTTGHGSIDLKSSKGSSGRHNGFLAFEQKLHRFVGAEFDYEGGSIVTEPLIFKGNRLVLNVDTGAMGEGHVALLNVDGKPIKNFSAKDCDIINCDWLEKTVSWRFGDKDVGALAGKPIRLEFKMRGARLYAFQFTSE